MIGRRSSKDTSIGFILISLLLLANAWVAYRNTAVLHAHDREVVYTLAVSDALGEILSTVQDAAADEHGYIITGDPAFMQSYEAATAHAGERLAHLDQLAASTPAREARLATLAQTIAQRLAFAAQVIALRQNQGFEAAERAVARGRGEALMGQLRTQTSAMAQIERDLLESRRVQAAHSYRMAIASDLGGALAGLGLVGLALYLVKRDLKARKRAAAATEEQKEWFRTTLSSIGDAVIATDASGLVTFVNPAAHQISGWGGEALGQPLQAVYRIIDEHTRAPLGSPAERVRRMGRIIGPTKDAVLIDKAGREVPVDDSAAPVRDSKGRLSGIVLVFRDISERRQVERLKQELVSIVSHEIRTPLTSIAGAVGLIHGGVAGELPAQAQSLIGIAQRNTERLARLVNDILDIDKIESGKMAFNFKSVELPALIDEVVATHRPYADKYAVQIEIDHAAPLPAIHGDPDRLAQVLINLLSNAVKFSPAGDKVTVRTVPNRDCVRVEVIDRGPGVPEHFRERIFQKFAQADCADCRARSGTGLGLSICKAIIERMGGCIGYESEAGQGATFYFDLPCSPAIEPCGRGAV